MQADEGTVWGPVIAVRMRERKGRTSAENSQERQGYGIGGQRWGRSVPITEWVYAHSFELNSLEKRGRVVI